MRVFVESFVLPGTAMVFVWCMMGPVPIGNLTITSLERVGTGFSILLLALLLSLAAENGMFGGRG